MTLRLISAFFLCTLPLACQTQAGAQAQSQTFTDAGLGITFDYPAAFVPDTSANQSPSTQRCMAVLLSVRTPDHSSGPQASLTLMEFKRSCATDEQWANHDRLLASLTKALYTQSGAKPIGQPLVYDYGGDLAAQRMHMSAIREQQNDSSGQSHELLLMDLATFVHDRAICWVIQSSNLAEFNQLSKLLVSFDGKRKVPLSPTVIQPKPAAQP